MGKGNETNTTTIQAPKFVEDQMRRTFTRTDLYRPEVYEGQRVADMNRDQMAFMDMARDYASQGFDAPEIDTSALERQMGRTADTSGVRNMIGQRVDTSGMQAMAGQRANTDLLRAAQQAQTDTSLLGGLRGQANAATDTLTGMTTREVTPYLETAVNDAADQALQNVFARYANSGRLGSMSFADQAGRGVTNAAAPILRAAAEADANRQQQAAGMLANISGQDMAREQALANAMTGFQAQDLGRAQQGAGLLANLENLGLNRDAQIAQQVANFENLGLNRDMAANQAALAASQADLAREAGLAGQLAGLSAEQARLAPMVEQINLNRMGLLGSIGDAQQQQAQLALAAEQARINESNLASQQAIANMLSAQGLGSNYLGQQTEIDNPYRFMETVAGAVATAAPFVGKFLLDGASNGGSGGGGAP